MESRLGAWFDGRYAGPAHRVAAYEQHAAVYDDGPIFDEEPFVAVFDAAPDSYHTTVTVLEFANGPVFDTVDTSYSDDLGSGPIFDTYVDDHNDQPVFDTELVHDRAAVFVLEFAGSKHDTEPVFTQEHVFDDLNTAGKPVEVREFEGQQHGFFTIDPWYDASVELMRIVKHFVNFEAGFRMEVLETEYVSGFCDFQTGLDMVCTVHANCSTKCSSGASEDPEHNEATQRKGGGCRPPDAPDPPPTISWVRLISWTQRNEMSSCDCVVQESLVYSVMTATLGLADGVVLVVHAAEGVMGLTDDLTTTCSGFGFDNKLPLTDVRRVFDEMPEWNVVSYNALLSEYAAMCDMSQALAVFDSMPTWTSVTWATLIHWFELAMSLHPGEDAVFHVLLCTPSCPALLLALNIAHNEATQQKGGGSQPPAAPDLPPLITGVSTIIKSGTKMRSGYGCSIFEPNLPLILGRDISGEVAAIGTFVSSCSIEQEEFGALQPTAPRGTYADYTVLPLHELTLKPPTLGHMEARAIPIAALTAWCALHGTARNSKGQRILVIGEGGVGLAPVQLAVAARCGVFATCGAQSIERVMGASAERAIDYTAEDTESAIEGKFDAVLDTIGVPETERIGITVLQRGGHYMTLQEEAATLVDKYGLAAESEEGKEVLSATAKKFKVLSPKNLGVVVEHYNENAAAKSVLLSACSINNELAIGSVCSYKGGAITVCPLLSWLGCDLVDDPAQQKCGGVGELDLPLSVVVLVSSRNDEREHTLNQFLTEMDGFEGNTGVIVITITNRTDNLGTAEKEFQAKMRWMICKFARLESSNHAHNPGENTSVDISDIDISAGAMEGRACSDKGLEKNSELRGSSTEQENNHEFSGLSGDMELWWCWKPPWLFLFHQNASTGQVWVGGALFSWSNAAVCEEFLMMVARDDCFWACYTV